MWRLKGVQLKPAQYQPTAPNPTNKTKLETRGYYLTLFITCTSINMYIIVNGIGHFFQYLYLNLLLDFKVYSMWETVCGP
ncbi:unnamed protein product [Lactuca virosa]|uniref:Uncharacterized protein n=1 Tax=Lactuca virosa TaxID=75947 RepID=A0AAU9LCM7_9ASTR|nr:unnamed protein product [Lactuca virosa]